VTAKLDDWVDKYYERHDGNKEALSHIEVEGWQQLLPAIVLEKKLFMFEGSPTDDE
jgi:hypothetical protein